MAGWSRAADAGRVHALLVASDAAAARRWLIPPPTRRLASTRALVASGHYYALRSGTDYLAAVVIGPDEPFDPAVADFTPSRTPWYMRRLSVDPAAAHDDPLVGIRAVMSALDTAVDGGADAVRCEINPAIIDVRDALTGLSFTACPVLPPADPERVGYLEWRR